MADAGSGTGFEVDPDVLFRASMKFMGSRDFVYSIASGVAGDLASTAGMAGDDSVAHSFARKYEPAARSVVEAIGTAGQGMATVSSRLLTMAANYLAIQDSVAAGFTGRINTSSPLAKGAQQCEENEAHSSLPMVTGSKGVHEIPVIGKFWPQGDPTRLRAAAQVWATCASVLDTAQRNAGRHAAEVLGKCSGEAFEGFRSYAATVYDPCPPGGTAVAASQPLMVNLSSACRELQSICEQYAHAVEACQDKLIELGIAAGVITAAGVILTVFTLGGSDAAAAAADAALAADALVAAEALATAEAELAAAAAVVEAEAIVSSLAARLVVLAGTAAAVTAVTAVTGLDAAGAATPPGPDAQQPGTPAAGRSPFANPLVGPVPPPVPPPYPLYDAAQQMAAGTWIQGLPERAPNYGTADDRAYQVYAAGKPERRAKGADGKEVWADGFRPADGAFIDAKNVRKTGCSPRSLRGIQEEDFRTGFMLDKDEDELDRYKGAIDNPDNHAQYLEIDTPDPATVGYWQYLLAKHHVKSNVRVVTMPEPEPEEG
ncbi:restriction endonuclease fold toxin-2 domain-containing protein [Kitasatospora purpeofusca]|uniref:restriction endonuclease fold toxin-2 domain-containing protein n=1 Tax=Kitasatospora purpeofusca TaxID=67352 RepID=UPI0035E272B0